MNIIDRLIEYYRKYEQTCTEYCIDVPVHKVIEVGYNIAVTGRVIWKDKYGTKREVNLIMINHEGEFIGRVGILKDTHMYGNIAFVYKKLKD